jgi:hypothetical protein
VPSFAGPSSVVRTKTADELWRCRKPPDHRTPGDLISVVICTAQGAGATTATVYFGNHSSGASTSQQITAPSGTTLAGNSAEWGLGSPSHRPSRITGTPRITDADAATCRNRKYRSRIRVVSYASASCNDRGRLAQDSTSAIATWTVIANDS